MSEESRLRVVRMIEIEGPRDWVLQTLDRSWLHPDRPSPVGGGRSARELARHTDIVRSVLLTGEEILALPKTET
jgi:hypothetical protein